MALAPIVIARYMCLEHLKKTIDALKSNELAQQAEGYTFSGTPRSGDEEAVILVRSFENNITRFKKVKQVSTKLNCRVESSQSAINQLCDAYCRVNWLEEDIKAVSGMLRCMSDASNFYQYDPSVISICGYSPPIDLSDSYHEDMFALPRYCVWGVFFLAGEFGSAELNYSEADRDCFFCDKFREGYIREDGNDLYSMIESDVLLGATNAGDFKGMYHQHENSKLALYTRFSLVENSDFDGIDIYFPKNDKLMPSFLWNKVLSFEFPAEIGDEKRFRQPDLEFRSCEL